MTTDPETFTETCESSFCEGFQVAAGDWVKSLISVNLDAFGLTLHVCEVCEDAMKGDDYFSEFNNW